MGLTQEATSCVTLQGAVVSMQCSGPYGELLDALRQGLTQYLQLSRADCRLGLPKQSPAFSLLHSAMCSLLAGEEGGTSYTVVRAAFTPVRTGMTISQAWRGGAHL